MQPLGLFRHKQRLDSPRCDAVPSRARLLRRTCTSARRVSYMRTRPGFALREVRQAFEHLNQQMQLMHGDCQIKPNDGNVIQFAGRGDDDVTLKCDPVVCRVPERASHGSASLYVVFAGSITFSGELLDNQLITKLYSTNFAYFDVDASLASHVLGGHYDFSPTEVAHPRAHLQLRSQAYMYTYVQQHYHSIADIPLVSDLMEDVLDRVRPPTAQMDFLSFMLQVTADHLVDEKSSAQVISVFNVLTSSCAPVFGYHVNMAEGCGCHRAAHWYPTN
jgi:hypothetical protein